MTATTMTMTDTNMYSEDSMTVKSPRIWRFLKSMPLVFHAFIAVDAMVCGRHGCGCHSIGPNINYHYIHQLNGVNTGKYNGFTCGGVCVCA